MAKDVGVSTCVPGSVRKKQTTRKSRRRRQSLHTERSLRHDSEYSSTVGHLEPSNDAAVQPLGGTRRSAGPRYCNASPGLQWAT